MKFIINDLNLRKQAEEMELKIWQTPGFLFIIMGIVATIIMAITYFIAQNYDDPRILIVSECSLIIIILAAGTIISRIFLQIAQLNKMKNEFIAVASHQLRTPLSAIRWETELLLTKYGQGLNEKQLKNIENISELGQKMAKLVNDLLDVARIDQDRLIIRKKDFNFEDAVKESFSGFAALAKDKNIVASLDLGKNLSLVKADPEKVKIVLDNLISNAVKYSAEGGRIEIKVFKRDKFMIFEIKDNGVGIPEEQMKMVFSKFFRSDNAVRYQTEGTGLGLYISKNIVEQLGGKMWFQSIENVGSLFGFSLPCTRAKLKTSDN